MILLCIFLLNIEILFSMQVMSFKTCITKIMGFICVNHMIPLCMFSGDVILLSSAAVCWPHCHVSLGFHFRQQSQIFGQIFFSYIFSFISLFSYPPLQ